MFQVKAILDPFGSLLEILSCTEATQAAFFPVLCSCACVVLIPYH